MILRTVAVMLGLIAANTHGETQESLMCRWCNHTFMAADASSSTPFKYSPDRRVDIEHLRVNVTPDFDRNTIAATASIRFHPIAFPLRQLELDAVDLDIQAVTVAGKDVAYSLTTDKLVITFAALLEAGKSLDVDIKYTAQPAKGIYFRTPKMGYKPGDSHLWTQGEPHEVSHWIPCFDYPNERYTTEIICHVPDDMIAVSNGKLVSVTSDANGLKSFRWLQDQPHVSYLIALVAGKFAKIETTYDDLSLRFLTPPSQAKYAKNSFEDTKEMMGWFERELGVKYPWAKYDQVVVDDYKYGGMENTSLTILTDRTLFADESQRIRTSRGLVAHELAHQWFGDLVTCRDWSHLWLNEGFATYYAHLYHGHRRGRDQLLYGLYNDAKRLLANKDKRPIVFQRYNRPWDQFDSRAYQKGSWVLHMLRTQLGDDVFRECVTHYLKQNRQRSAVTPDLIRAFQERTGLSLQRFFNQWVYHGGHPSMEVGYRWDEATKTAKVSVKQTQKVDDEVLLFACPVKLRFIGKGMDKTVDVVVDEVTEAFEFTLESQPDIVRFDSDYGLLAAVRFNKPVPMLYAQLAEDSDVIGRLKAIEALKSRKDDKTIAKLAETMRNDPFHGVRAEAADALSHIRTDETLKLLIDADDDRDAWVMNRRVAAIAKWYDPKVRVYLLNRLSATTNPVIQASLVRGLGMYHDPEVYDRLIGLLDSRTHRNMVVGATIGVMRSLDERVFIEPLQTVLKERESDLTSHDFGRGLTTLAFLARDMEDRSTIRTFLLGYIRHPKQTIARLAIEALGTLRDTKAVPILEPIARREEDDAITKAAKAAVDRIRQSQPERKQVDSLRKEVDKLRKANADLTKQVEGILERLGKDN